MTKPKISITIPVYNNQSTLEMLHKRIVKALAKDFDYEIIFVNDASKDASLGTLQNITKQYTQVKIIDLQQNVGQNRAILKAWAMAEGTYCICLDADLQDPPEAIPMLITQIQTSQKEVVFAGRHFNRYNMNYPSKYWYDSLFCHTTMWFDSVQI